MNITPFLWFDDNLDEALTFYAEVFPDTVVPRDFDLIEVPFPERGAPALVKGGGRPPRAEPAEVPMIEPS